MPLLKSWVESANSATSPFPLNNLPYGVYSIDGQSPCCGVAIGEMILDVSAPLFHELGTNIPARIFASPSWNEFMSQGSEVWQAFRATLQAMLSCEVDGETQAKIAGILVPQNKAIMHMPFEVAEFTDFYSGKNHALNVGTMFRGAENALPPNWLHLPIAYNGRASSVVVSGTEIRRPWGQIKPQSAEAPIFAPCNRFDIELEMGAIIGQGSTMGRSVSVAEADEMIFGFVLLNDWSARDVQAWEYQPLGPFQAKATATSISPWIITKAALEPFRTSTPTREVPLLPYLKEPKPMLYDIDLEISLLPEGSNDAFVIAKTSTKELYYSAAQQLAHHTTSGCAMRVGDLLGSGTISGPEKINRGSMLELSWGGAEPFELANGEKRMFIEDNDTLTLSAQCAGDGYIIGFGDCWGKVLPAIDDPYKR